MELTLDSRLCEKEEQSLASCRTATDYKFTSLIGKAPGEFQSVGWGMNSSCFYYTEDWQDERASTIGSTELKVEYSEVERTDEGFWRNVDVTVPNYGSVSFAFDVAFWGSGTRANPNWIALYFKDDALPSIDISKMRECGAENWMVKEKNGKKRASFPFREMDHSTRCLYNVLDQGDQEVVKEVVENVENIMAQATEGEPDVAYWKKIAKIIKNNGANVIQ